MQYDAGFLLYQLQYLSNYEDWTIVKNATSWSHKANNSSFCNAVTSMGNPKMPQNSEKV